MRLATLRSLLEEVKELCNQLDSLDWKEPQSGVRREVTEGA